MDRYESLWVSVGLLFYPRLIGVEGVGREPIRAELVRGVCILDHVETGIPIHL